VRSLKAQMRYADKINAAYTMVLGDTEIESGKAVLKDMSTGAQTEILIDESFVPNFSDILIKKQLEATTDAAAKM
ncbi:MAG: His/Gly/Thr/Pro-type tRNA ligase C-terminal domain-containing protein, partial [Oscillospiraceae bacterium]